MGVIYFGNKILRILSVWYIIPLSSFLLINVILSYFLLVVLCCSIQSEGDENLMGQDQEGKVDIK